jgi:hypothetical protein
MSDHKAPGLPDGVFSNQKYKLGFILKGLGMQNVGIFYGHLEYCSAIWNIVRPFGILLGHLVFFMAFLVYFVAFWYIFIVLVWRTKKNLATLHRTFSC